MSRGAGAVIRACASRRKWTLTALEDAVLLARGITALASVVHAMT